MDKRCWIYLYARTCIEISYYIVQCTYRPTCILFFQIKTLKYFTRDHTLLATTAPKFTFNFFLSKRLLFVLYSVSFPTQSVAYDNISIPKQTVQAAWAESTENSPSICTDVRIAAVLIKASLGSQLETCDFRWTYWYWLSRDFEGKFNCNIWLRLLELSKKLFRDREETIQYFL